MTFIDSALLIIQMVVMLFILVRLFVLMSRHERTATVIFFVFAIVSNLLSIIYWLGYDILYPDIRMPFAANEIGEWAVFLSLGASLSTRLKKITAPAIKETIATVLFVSANVALWIAWSGEWAQDIITGIVLLYFFTNLVKFLKQSEVLSNVMWIVLGCFCVLIIVANVAGFFVPVDLKGLHEVFAYILLLTVLIYIIARTIISLIGKKKPDTMIGLSYASFAWNIIVLYMSSGVIYQIVVLALILSFFMMFLSHEKEVRA